MYQSEDELKERFAKLYFLCYDNEADSVDFYEVAADILGISKQEVIDVQDQCILDGTMEIKDPDEDEDNENKIPLDISNKKISEAFQEAFWNHAEYTGHLGLMDLAEKHGEEEDKLFAEMNVDCARESYDLSIKRLCEVAGLEYKDKEVPCIYSFQLMEGEHKISIEGFLEQS